MLVTPIKVGKTTIKNVLRELGFLEMNEAKMEVPNFAIGISELFLLELNVFNTICMKLRE